VCGTCHTIFATRFALSTHSYVFDRGCVECHGNHDILQPSDEMLGTDSVALCGACHGEGEPGFEAARTMRSGIERLKTAIETATVDVTRASQAGMEMGDATLALREAVNHLTLARTEVHTFDVALVDAVLEEGLTTVAAVEETAQAAFAELRFRRLGLGLSLAAILLVVAALAYKIRTLPPSASRQT
jgi:predicted CXXCH cytochrome family protein